MPADIYNDYDGFAWFYNKYWGAEFARPALAILNILLFPHLKPGASILDLCCGAGQLSQGLSARGYEVTGLDGSERMLEFAVKNAPSVDFVHADARSFDLPQRFDAVISSFDSLNHILEKDELLQVFRNAHRVLKEGGLFLFDLNLEDEFEARGNSISMLEDDHACIVRAGYDPAKKLKRYDVTMFFLADGTWSRTDLTLLQRYYDIKDVLNVLEDAGFRRIRTYDARKEFGFTLNDGRIFYMACK